MSNLYLSEKAQVKDHRIYKLQKLMTKDTDAKKDEKRIQILVFDFKVAGLHRSKASICFINLRESRQFLINVY